MSKYSGSSARPVGFVPQTIPTHEGGQGFTRTPQQELFLLAVSEMAEDTYYESKEDRRQRLASLIQQVVSQRKGWEFVSSLVPWLRKEAGMRSASIMVAAEAVAVGRPEGAGGLTSRQLISAAILRADEPAEMLGYWHEFHGRKIPAAVKRGIADSAQRLYNERNSLRYDGQSRGIRMGDVIELTHPQPSTSTQSSLFKQLIDNRHNRDGEIAGELLALRARASLESLAPDQRHAFMRLVQAGNVAETQIFEDALAGQWEWAKSWLGSK